MKKKKKHKGFAISLLLAAGVSLILFYGKIGSDKSVANVGGHPITEPEYQFFLNQTKSDTIRYFKSTYGVSLEDGLWEKSYHGEKPIDVWEKTALGKAVHSKAEQVAAFEKEIVPDISYDYFLKEMKKENQRRAEILSQGKILYGLRKYTEKTYYDYVQSNIRLQLKAELAKTDMHLDEETLRKKYEEKKQELFYEGCELRVEIVYCKTEQLHQLVGEHLCTEICEGKLRQVIKQDNLKESTQKVEGVTYKEVFLYPTDQNSEEYWRYWLYQNMNEMQAGDTAGIYRENGHSFILRCIEKKDLGYQSFERTASTIQNLYVEEQYDDYIQEVCEGFSVNRDMQGLLR